MNQDILFYDPKKEYGEFSNYYKSSFTINGVTFKTSEHYYQAYKFLNGTNRGLEYAQLILQQTTANKAKVLAVQKISGGYKWRLELNEIIKKYLDVKIRPDWEFIKDNVMRAAVMNKFGQNEKLFNLLVDTRNSRIVEHSRDAYWGDGLGNGLNMLGKVLMEVRRLFYGNLNGIILQDYLYIENYPEKVDVIVDLEGNIGSGGIVIYSVGDCIASVGRKYKTYIHCENIERRNLFLTKLLEELYQIDSNVSTELVKRM